MNELYNDLSSSDDDEEETKAPEPQPSSAASSASKDTKAITSGKTNDKADDAINPFKRQASNAQEEEALRELYGEDYEEVGGKNSGEVMQGLKEKLKAKFSGWFTKKAPAQATPAPATTQAPTQIVTSASVIAAAQAPEPESKPIEQTEAASETNTESKITTVIKSKVSTGTILLAFQAIKLRVLITHQFTLLTA